MINNCTFIPLSSSINASKNVEKDKEELQIQHENTSQFSYFFDLLFDAEQFFLGEHFFAYFFLSLSLISHLNNIANILYFSLV